MVRIASFSLAVVLGGLTFAAPIPKEINKRPDEERILGVWDMKTSEVGGRDYTKAIWVFEKGKMFSRSLDQTAGGTEWAIKLDPNKTPKEIDIGGYPGIYEFDGDHLKIAYKLSAPRPTNFKAEEGKYYCVMTFARENK